MSGLASAGSSVRPEKPVASVIIDPYTLEAVYDDGTRISGIELHRRQQIYKDWWRPLGDAFKLLAKKNTIWGHDIKYGAHIPLTVDMTEATGSLNSGGFTGEHRTSKKASTPVLWRVNR